jgi:hypothetical protein
VVRLPTGHSPEYRDPYPKVPVDMKTIKKLPPAPSPSPAATPKVPSGKHEIQRQPNPRALGSGKTPPPPKARPKR